jgi:hypothetical protein
MLTSLSYSLDLAPRLYTSYLGIRGGRLLSSSVRQSIVKIIKPSLRTGKESSESSLDHVSEIKSFSYLYDASANY